MLSSLIGTANSGLLRVVSNNGIVPINLSPNAAYRSNFNELLTLIMNVVLTIGVIAVLFFMIWGGLEWITSGGDKGKTESARNKITAAVVGLIIVISAWAVTMFVQSLLGINVIQ